MNGGAAEYNRVLKCYNDTEDIQIRKYPMNTIGSTSVNELKLKTLDWAVKSGDIKLQDIFYPIGSVSTSTAGTELSWKYYKDVSTELSMTSTEEFQRNLFDFYRTLISSRKNLLRLLLLLWMLLL